MEADNKVVSISLSDVPVVPIFERDRGNKVSVLFVLVRTDYDEIEEEAVKRAQRIAARLTTDMAVKKTIRTEDSPQVNSQ